MAKVKTVQIPEELFYQLAMYFETCEPDPAAVDLFRACHKGLIEKYNAIQQRNLYSRSINKDLPVPDRERARQEYLDNKGIPDSFRWSAAYEQARQDKLI